MQTIIGLGQAGCKISDQLAQYPQYQVLKIDVGLRKTKKTLGFKLQSSPEDYEKKPLPRGTEKFLEGVMPETLLITSCGAVSGAALRLLEKIHKKTKISVMYIIPKYENLSHFQFHQNNLLFNVFQEYARSSAIERVFLVDNQKTSDIMGPVPILKYWESLNYMISSTYHMINVFDHSHPVFTTFTRRYPTARVTSFGCIDFENNEEKCFFKLDMPREKRYYYAIPQKMLEEDVSLMEKIQINMKEAVEHDKMKVSYSVYSSEYDIPYVYCENSSTLVQKLAF